MKIEVANDYHIIIKTIMEVASCTEEYASSLLMEIGLRNLLAFPTGNIPFDKILGSDTFQIIIFRLKEMKGIYRGLENI